jgi:hypothetical protein
MDPTFWKALVILACVVFLVVELIYLGRGGDP